MDLYMISRDFFFNIKGGSKWDDEMIIIIIKKKGEKRLQNTIVAI